MKKETEGSSDMNQPAESPSRDELISELCQIDSSLDRLPYPSDISEKSDYTVEVYRTKFGSWDDALEAAGINKEEELLRELQQVTVELGRKPTATEMNSMGRYSSSMYARYFGQWSTAKEHLDEESREVEPQVTESEELEQNGADDSQTHTAVDSGEEEFEWNTSLETSSKLEAQGDSKDAAVDGESRYTREELEDYLNKLFEIFGEPPTEEFVTHYGSYPISAYENQFGSWKKALESAGLSHIGTESLKTRKQSRVDILDELCEYAAEIGEVPDPIDVWKNTGLYAISVSDNFGNLSTAFELAGITEEAFKQETDDQQNRPETPIPDSAGVVQELKRIGTVPADPPTPYEFERQSILSVVTVRDVFDTWISALKNAGYDGNAAVGDNESPQGYMRQELLEEVRRVTIRVGAVPTTSDFDKYADMTSQTVKNHFANWETALEEAGITGLSSEEIVQLWNEYMLPADQDLLNEVEWVDDAVAGQTTSADIRSFARYPPIYFEEVFGSVDRAIEEFRNS